MRPTVSICIPTYNQAAYLAQALQSCLNQTYTNIEIWIADDCSTDHTFDVVQPFLPNPNIHYHKQANNLGISANNNWLLAQPHSDFILRLDSDDALHPDYITTLLPALLNDSKIGYAHAAVWEINPRGQEQRLRSLHRSTGTDEAMDALVKSIYGYRVAANICLFRASVLKELSYYKPGLNFGEDWELSIRIAAAGYKNYYSNKALAYYRVWNDTNNIRAKRKLIEINGIGEIFKNTLQPAFVAHHLSLQLLIRAQKASALNHSLALAQKEFSDHEKAALKISLLNLSSSWQVKLKILLIECGFAALFVGTKKTTLYIKDQLKKILH